VADPLSKRMVRTVAREVMAFAVALALWTGLSLTIVSLAWRPTSVWWYVLLPLYLPAPAAAFIYVLLTAPRTRNEGVKRGVFLVVVGWVLVSPLPDYPLWAQLLKVFRYFGVVPTTGEDPLLGVFVGSLLSFLLIGTWYCGCSGYWAGQLGYRMREQWVSK